MPARCNDRAPCALCALYSCVALPDRSESPASPPISTCNTDDENRSERPVANPCRILLAGAQRRWQIMNRKTLFCGLLGLGFLGGFVGEARSLNPGSFWNRQNRYTSTITVRPYNAFTPICWGNLVCDGCNPNPCNPAASLPMHCGVSPFASCYGGRPCMGDACGASDMGMFYNPQMYGVMPHQMHGVMPHMLPPVYNGPGPIPGPNPNPNIMGPMPGGNPYGPGPGPFMGPQPQPGPYGPGPGPFMGPQPGPYGPGPGPYMGPPPQPGPYGPGPGPFMGPPPQPGAYGPGPYMGPPQPGPYGPGPGPGPGPYGPSSGPFGPGAGPQPGPIGSSLPSMLGEVTPASYPGRMPVSYPAYYTPMNHGWNQAVPNYWYGNGR